MMAAWGAANQAAILIGKSRAQALAQRLRARASAVSRVVVVAQRQSYSEPAATSMVAECAADALAIAVPCPSSWRVLGSV